MTERVAFKLGASAYNLLSHPTFVVPNGNAASGSLGLITSIYGTGQGTTVSGRVLVVTGRLTF